MDLQNTLEKIQQNVQPLFGQGKRADYIPVLAKVDPRKLGIAVVTLDGQVNEVGDSREKFSLQSISKVFNLVLGMRSFGDELWQRVGIEPSGSSFNSLVQLEYEHGIPRNPFINAGALVVIDALLDSLQQPNEEMLHFAQTLGCERVQYNDETVRSEKSCGFTNMAMANLIKAHSNLSHDVETVLDVYYHQCSLEMNCVDLARAFMFLANRGVVPCSNIPVLSASQTKRINAIMLTCGFYDEAGEFAYRVGLPGKSGVGGGIVAVIPGELAIAVWSPELNAHGNSLIGMQVLEEFTTLTGMSIF